MDFKSISPTAKKAKVLADVLFYCTTTRHECDHSEILEYVIHVNEATEEVISGEVYAALFALTDSGSLLTNTVGAIACETRFKAHPSYLQMVHKGAWGFIGDE